LDMPGKINAMVDPFWYTKQASCSPSCMLVKKWLVGFPDRKPRKRQGWFFGAQRFQFLEFNNKQDSIPFMTSLSLQYIQNLQWTCHGLHHMIFLYLHVTHNIICPFHTTKGDQREGGWAGGASSLSYRSTNLNA
jgi:hypothetical protein